VPMIEEGRDARDPLVRLALRQYLHPLLSRRIDVLLLACTHFPVLMPAVCNIMGQGVTVIDGSRRCAEDVARRLKSAGKLAEGTAAGIRPIVTDEPARFRAIARKMLGLTLDDPTLVRLDALPSEKPAVFVRAA
jgi:glutamate racemase